MNVFSYIVDGASYRRHSRHGAKLIKICAKANLFGFVGAQEVGNYSQFKFNIMRKHMKNYQGFFMRTISKVSDVTIRMMKNPLAELC